MFADVLTDGRTLVAVVVGATSVDTRAEEAAAMLTRGFSQKTAGLPTLASLKPAGTGIGQATTTSSLSTAAGTVTRRPCAGRVFGITCGVAGRFAVRPRNLPSAVARCSACVRCC